MSLLQVPREVWDTIECHLNGSDLRQLSKACRQLMDALQDKAYRRIVFDETPKSGRGVLALASGPRARHVRRIQYSPHDPKPVVGWDEERNPKNEHDPSVKLSDETQQALGSLHRFEGLSKFRFILLGWGYWPMMPRSLHSYSFSDYHGPYDKEPWRVLLEESLSALSKSAGAFTELEIENLPPIPDDLPYKTFDTNEWRALLHPLTSLEITLGSHPDGGTGNLTVVHQHFIAAFTTLNFAHLPNVTRLRLTGNEDGFIGHYIGKRHVPWEDFKLPCLTTFELECSYVDESHLGKFIMTHSDTLREIYMRYCLADWDGSWNFIFEGLAAKDIKELIELRIVAYPVRKRSLYRTTEEWENAMDDMSDTDSEENGEIGWLRCEEHGTRDSRVWEKVRLDDRNRRFVVGETCESYGKIQPSELNAESDNEDDDWDEADIVESWEKLQVLVNRNRTAAGLPSLEY